MNFGQQIQLHAIVSGRVQGVSFRYYACQYALKLGIRGWVQNNSDGTVEVLAQGTREQLERLLDFLHTGSPGARVEDLQANWSAILEPVGPFCIRYPSSVSR